MNPSIAYIRSSDGSGDASLMTITQVRTAPATTIMVNTVAGAPTNFFATMGTPHTFNDPVTGETITVISEATAVNFAGRIDSGRVEIVAIAPGETDLGSKVGDIIIIRPTTQWADNIYGVLSKSLNDDGTLKVNSVTPAAIAPSAVKADKIDFASLMRSVFLPMGEASFNTTNQLVLSLDVTSLRAGGIITVSLLSFGWSETVAGEGIAATIATNLGTIAAPYGNRADNNKMLSFSISFPKTNGMTTVMLYMRTQIATQNIDRMASIVAM